MPPFRNPVSEEEDDWSPPDYAAPVKVSEKSDEKWTPPSYAIAVKKKEAPKASVFSRAYEAIVHPKRPSKITEPLIPDFSEAIDTAAKFLKEHPTVRDVGRRLLTGPSREELGGKELVGPELMKTPGVEELGSRIKEAGIKSGSYWKGALASIAGDILSGLSAGFDPRTAGAKAEGLPIRRGREIPYRMEAPVEAKAAKVSEAPEVPKIEEVPKVEEPKKPFVSPFEKKPETVKLYRGESESSVIGPGEEAGRYFTDRPDVALYYSKRGGGKGRTYSIELSPEEAAKYRDLTSPEEGAHLLPQDLAEKARTRQLGEKAAEEPIIKPKEITIENAPPNQRAKMYRGAHEPVNILFENPKDREIFGSGQRLFSKGKAKPDLIQRFTDAQNRISKEYNISPQEARGHIIDYNAEVRRMGSAVDKEGGNITAPSFKDFIESRTSKPSEVWKPPEYATPVEKPSEALSARQQAEDFSRQVLEPEIVPEGKGLKSNQEFIEEGHKVPEIQDDGSIYVHNLYGKGMGGGATEQEVKFINDTNRMKRNRGEIVPDEFKLPETVPKATTLEEQLSEMEKGLPKIESYEGRPEITYMHGGLGGIKPPSESYPKSQGPAGAALDELFGVLSEAKDLTEKQAAIYKTERAKRFAAFAGVKEEGAAGAAKSLSKLKGEFEKVQPVEGRLSPEHTDTLFTAVKRANITEGEKARGYTALFKLLNGEQVPVRSELKILDDVFGNGFADRIVEMHGGIGAVGLKVAKLASTMKSMQSSVDLSAPFRQGIGLVTRKEFYPAFRDMFRFFANKEFYNSSMKALEERPNYLLGRESGLFLAKPDNLMGAEEAFLKSYAGGIPIVRTLVGASDRAYTGFLNKLRADTFDSMIKKAESLGHETSRIVGQGDKAITVPSKETEAISKFINNATGRGDLGSLNKMTNELNLLLWSPRFIASRVTMLTNPNIYTDLPKGMRMDGIKSLLGIATLGTMIDTLAVYGGAKVSTNILSVDFGKSRFGTKLLDPWGGFQQYVVGAARFLAGKTDSSYPTSRLQIAGRFAAGKESPAASLAHTLLTAKKFEGEGKFTTQYGQKTSIQSEIGKKFVPMFVQDLYDLATNEPDFSEDIGLNTALGAAALFGMGVQNYPEKKQGRFRKMKLR